MPGRETATARAGGTGTATAVGSWVQQNKLQADRWPPVSGEAESAGSGEACDWQQFWQPERDRAERHRLPATRCTVRLPRMTSTQHTRPSACARARPWRAVQPHARRAWVFWSGLATRVASVCRRTAWHLDMGTDLIRFADGLYPAFSGPSKPFGLVTRAVRPAAAPLRRALDAARGYRPPGPARQTASGRQRPCRFALRSRRS